MIKPERDRDLYVCWSTITECPIAWGDRAFMLDHLTREHPADGAPIAEPGARLDRADLNGTSALGGFSFFGKWDDEGFVYEQRGVLPRQHLARACELLNNDREAEVWDLLEPFEEEMAVRRG
ncbi:hypothetical protein AAFH96_06215 [Polymorphospora sp. 2-325]|uniref:C2H2-type domain-containing protein n=1 Tax=Polymorphospora lycopeni TaxID=3140240 RepID=A0ABV5CNU0_9ACTN